jgi:hypothetical protein
MRERVDLPTFILKPCIYYGPYYHLCHIELFGNVIITSGNQIPTAVI